MTSRSPRVGRVIVGGLALLAAAAFAVAPLLLGQSEARAEAGPAEAVFTDMAGGPPPCLGYTIDDPCITPQALAQCRKAVRQCGNDPIAVIETCPLQFLCGR